MGAGCQRNRLVMGVGRGEEVYRKGCPYIRQLANSVNKKIKMLPYLTALLILLWRWNGVGGVCCEGSRVQLTVLRSTVLRMTVLRITVLQMTVLRMAGCVRALPSAELPSRRPTLPRFTGHSQNSSLCPRMYKRAIVTYVYQSTVQNIVQSVCRDISESVCSIFHSLNADSEVNQHETV